MKARIAISLCVLKFLVAGSVLAQPPQIGLYSDAACQNSLIGTQQSLPPLTPVTWYLAVSLSPGDPGISGAEFRLAGLDSGPFTVGTAPSAAVSVGVGDPVGEGVSLGLQSCEAGPCVLLYTVTVTNLSLSAESTDPLTIESHLNPMDPNYPCPLVSRCDDPEFTRQCATPDYCGPELVDGGFELLEPGPPPLAYGYWGNDQAAAVAGELGITPYQGSEMLKFLGTTQGGASASGAVCDVQQLVGLCLVSNVEGGNVGALASARFNRVTGDAETDRMFQLTLQAHAGDPANFDGSGALAEISESLISDGNLATWEKLSASLIMPPGTDYVALWVRAVEDVVNDGVAPEFDGHYVDDVRLAMGTASDCVVMPPSIDFGTVTSSMDSSITIVNRGVLPIQGNVASSCPDFGVLSGSGPFVLQKDESLVVDIRYDPQSVGSHQCSLDLTIGECGPVAYVADRSAGMQLLDIADPTNPQLVSTWAGISEAPALKEGHAIVAHGGKWVRFVNVQSPANPFQVNSREIGCCTRDVVSLGDLALVARSGTLQGLVIFDVADPASPSQLGVYSGADDVWKLDARGDHAYLASDGAGLLILDVSDPANPSLDGQFVGTAPAYGVDVEGDLAYLAVGDGLQIINVADPANPYQVGEYVSGSSANDVAVRHGIAYLLSSPNNVALMLVDVSDPGNPTLLSSLSGPASLDSIELFAGHAYVGATTAGLWIVDIADPANPLQVALYDTPGDARGLAIGGGVQLMGALEGATDAPEAPLLGLRLEAGHPNPFVAQTTLQFGLERSGRVEMAVYDLAGRRVRTLAWGRYPAGRHFVHWDGRDQAGNDVAQGVYLIRMSDRSQSLSRKVVHIR